MQDIAADIKSREGDSSSALQNLQLSILTPGDNTCLAAAAPWLESQCHMALSRGIFASLPSLTEVSAKETRTWTDADCGDPVKLQTGKDLMQAL